MLGEIILPVKFSKTVFLVWNFMRSLKFYYSTKQFSVSRLKSDFSAVNWKAESDEILQVYFTEIILNTATIRVKLEWN